MREMLRGRPGWVLGFALTAAVACSATTRSPFGNSGGSSDSATSAGTSGNGGASTVQGNGGSTGTNLTIAASGAGGGSCAGGCSPDFHQVLDCDSHPVETCSGANGCDPKAGTCKNACQVAVDNKLAVGCEYYATYMDAYSGNCFAAFVANTWNTPAHVTVDYGGQALPLNFGYTAVGSGPTLSYQPLANGAIPAGEVGILFLAGEKGQAGPGQAFCPQATAMPTATARFSGTGMGKSFHIVSDVPVVVYEINPYGGGSAAVTGASLLLPTSVWGTNYVAVNAYEANDVSSPSMNIIAAQDNTKVTLLPINAVQGGKGVPSGPQNAPLTFMLQKGQHAQLSQPAPLSGSVLQTDKPVGFMAGHVCAFIPKGVFYCDHHEQMIPPVPALGNEYVGVQYRPRKGEPAIWRLIGALDGTKLTWTPNVGGPATLNQGQIVEVTTGTPFVVTSQDKDHPFILFEHMSGSTWNMGQQMDGYGDADAVLSVPTKQYLRDYVFFADPTYPETNLVVVRAKGGDGKFADVSLDCAGKLTGWQPIGNYEWARTDLITGNFMPVGKCSTGRHEIKSDAPFGLWVWGWGTPLTGGTFTSNVSYGYPGGMNVVPINNVVIVPNPK